MPKYCWCIDPGHGPLTQGKKSPIFRASWWKIGSRFFEFEFNRDIASRLCKMLSEAGVEYMVTVPLDPKWPIGDALKFRVDQANAHKSENQKIFLSIHSNAGPTEVQDAWSNAHGVETWFFHGSKIGAKLATIFNDHIVKATLLKDRGIKSKEDKQFYVLRKTSMLAILTENGFYNNRQEVEQLMQDGFRQTIAKAHFDAIMEVESKGVFTKV
jgi:N-acetylmuramoyl-L-alanine amidase